MNTNFDTNSDINLRTAEACCCPEVGSLLPAYIVESLDDAAALIVEEHLVECQHCKARYLTVVRARAAARRKHERINAHNGNGNHKSATFGDAEIRKHRPGT